MQSNASTPGRPWLVQRCMSR